MTAPTLAAGSLSRRASLLGFGGATIAALAASSTAAKKKKRKKETNNRCKKQESRCREAVLDMCARNDIPLEICERSFLRCCPHFNTCDAAQALDCLQFNDPGEPV